MAKDIEYTEMAIIKSIECDCGNVGVVQVHKGFITWKTPSDALKEALKENIYYFSINFICLEQN